MKEIKAIVQPFMLQHVLNALHEIHRELGSLPAVTVSEVQGISVESGLYEPVKKTKLEIMVPDELAERVLTAIQTHAHTGKAGEGRVFVIPIEATVKIRTGERDESKS